MKRLASAIALGLVSTLTFAQGVSAPYTNNFDSAGWQGPEWTSTTSVAAGRIRVLSTTPLSPQGGSYLAIDVSTTNTVCTVNLSLAISGATVTPGTLLKYYAKDTSDEADVGVDGCFISNGVNEFQVVDHTTLTGTWAEKSVDLFSAAQTAGIALNASFRVIFRWRDNNPMNSDGVQLDNVRLIPAPIPDVGQANTAAARLTLGTAVNINGQGYVDSVNGPYFATRANGSTLNFTVQGPANGIYVIVAGPLNRNNLIIPSVGSLDLGSNVTLNDVFIVIDGTAPGLINSLAVIPSTGTSTLSFPLPTLPVGVWTTFQAAVVTPSGITLSAATQITVS